jgi:hypothetical protein
VTVRPLTALAALALFVAGCAAATPYHPMGLEGGYSQTRLGADLFTVIFQGNAHLPRRTAESYALYRTAEVSIESGFDYFVVVGGNSDVSRQLLAGRDPAPPDPDGDTDHPMVSLIVRGFRGEKPSAQAFNAREVLRELGPTIKRQ